MVRHTESMRTRKAAWAACVLAFVAVAGVGHAQPEPVRVTITTSNETPIVGEQFQVQMQAELVGGAIGQFEAPDFGGLRVLGQSSVMRSQSIRQVMGQRPQIELRETVAFAVVADREGVYTLRGAGYRMGRRTFEGDPIVIKVGPSAMPTLPPAGAAAQAAGDSATFDPNAFVRAVVDRTEAYVGEQVTLTLYLYVNAQLPVTNVQLVRAPSTSDFWVQDLRPPQASSQRETQVVRGVQYDVHVVRRLALFPLRAGRLEAGGTEMRIEVGGMLSLFQRRSSDELRTACAAIPITVRPLPSGAPAGTVVGDVTFAVDTDRRVLRTGEAVTLTATIHGRGSLRDVTLATPDVPGLRFEPPTIEDVLDTTSDVVGGERRIRWQVVPTRPGRLTIPPFVLPTFEPTSGRLDARRSAEIVLEVSGDALADEETEDAGVDTLQEDDADAPLTFGPASRRSELRRARRALSAHPAYLPIVLGAPLLVAVAWLARGLGRRLVAFRERARAGKGRERPMVVAERALLAGDAVRFYSSITAALHEALDRALATRTAGMTHVALRTMLERRGADPDLVARTIDELDAADFARFSAAGVAVDEMRRTLERTSALLERLSRTALHDDEGASR